MNSVMTFFGALVRNKWFWITVAVLVAFLVIRANWARLKHLFKVDRGDYSDPPPGDSRQGQLEAMAREGYSLMDGWFNPLGNLGTQHWIERMLALNDTELRYIAEFFPSISDGDSLYAWVDDEALPTTDVDQQLMARLAQMALD